MRYIITYTPVINLLLADNSSFTIYTFDSQMVSILEGESSIVAKLVDKFELGEDFSVTRLMNIAYFISSKDDLRRLSRVFFDHISNHYDGIVTKENNESCALELLRIASECTAFMPNSILLDFGCGTGISSAIFGKSAKIVYGYDFSGKMVEKCQDRGIIAFNKFSLIPIPIDHCFACYVMHFGVTQNDVKEIKEVLKPGGLFVCNFHKGALVNEAELLFDKCGMTRCYAASGKFGPIRVFCKS